MTECERIIKQGLLPNSFFDEEVRNDFLIDKNRKKVWAIELDILIEFDRVCKENGLKYYLAAGTLLGAIRHNGFIPWDDDLDVAMPRKDYDFLLSHSELFSHPYFLQTPYTDKGFYFASAKLRNSNTSAMDWPFIYQGFNLGIHIDIIPIDKICIDDGEALFNKLKELIILNSVAMRITHPLLSQRDKQRVLTYPGGDPLERYELIQSLAKRDYNKTTSHVAYIVCPVYGYKRHVFLNEDFSRSVLTEFEGFRFPVPVGYERILSTEYDNWRQMPTIEERGKWHGNVFFEPDRPYNEFLPIYLKQIIMAKDKSNY